MCYVSLIISQGTDSKLRIFFMHTLTQFKNLIIPDLNKSGHGQQFIHTRIYHPT